MQWLRFVGIAVGVPLAMGSPVLNQLPVAQLDRAAVS